jgi:flagellar biogenesis protein FliO
LELLPPSVAILFVFALLGLTLWWLKRKGVVKMAAFLPPQFTARRPKGEARLLERVDSLQLSPTHSVSLIRMADRAILIGISPGGFCLVESSPWKALQPAKQTDDTQ